MHDHQRVIIVGEGPSSLSAAEHLIAAGMCVDLISSSPAPLGLLQRYASDALNPCGPPAATPPRLRLIGNVKVGARPGEGGDITHAELHRLAATGQRELIILELKARGIPVTTWEGLCVPLDGAEPTDWEAIQSSARHAGVRATELAMA